MQGNPPGLGPILKSLGISAAGIDKIQFGSGVVGKLTTALMGLFVVCFAAIAAGAWMGSTLLVGGGLVAASFGFVFMSVASMMFANRNPAAALHRDSIARVVAAGCRARRFPRSATWPGPRVRSRPKPLSR